MSERYTRLFSLPKNLYINSSPVLIAAGTLLKDNRTSKVLAQLKFQNIGVTPIKAVTVNFQPLDTVGNPLGEKVTFQYLDLNALRNTEFGSKIPVVFSDASVRAYQVCVTEVVFVNNTKWQTDQENWQPLATPVSLEHSLEDEELVTQYRIQCGTDCIYEPTTCNDLWYCSCGALNRDSETHCHRCRKSLAALLAVDKNMLMFKRDERIAAEQQISAERKAAAAARVKKVAKLALIITPVVVLLVIASVVITNVVKKHQAETALLQTYESAIAFLDDEQYDRAVDVFRALGDYRDSAELADRAETLLNQVNSYSKAESLLAEQNYSDAYALYTALGDYKDSSGKALECAYEMTVLSLSVEPDGEYASTQKEAYDWFSAHKDYKNSAAYLADFVERIVSVKNINSDTNEISSENTYIYDNNGQASSAFVKYTGSNSSYLHTIEQRNYGNWYVVKYSQENSTPSVYLYYRQPYGPPFNSPRLFEVGSFFDFEDAIYTDKQLRLFFDDDGIQYDLTCFENGDISYVTKRDGEYDKLNVRYSVDITTNNLGLITGVTTTGVGVADDGRSYYHSVSKVYQYDAYGNQTDYSYKETENWGGETKTRQSERSYQLTYQKDKLLSEDSTVYEYAYVYCPDANE